MNSKLLILSIMCIVCIIPSAFSASIFGPHHVIHSTIGDLKKIGAKMIETKINAVSNATGEIITAGTVALEKKGYAVVNAATTMVGAGVNAMSSAAVTLLGAIPKMFMALLAGASSSGGVVVEERPIVIEPAVHVPVKPVGYEVFQPVMPIIVSENVAPIWTSVQNGRTQEIIQLDSPWCAE